MTTTDTRTTISDAPTRHAALAAWVDEVAALTTPDAVHWVDGTEAENDAIVDALVAGGTFTRLTGKPDSYWCATDPSDVARVEDRTYICSKLEEDAGPTNHWMDPDDMRATMTAAVPRRDEGPHHVRDPVRDGPAQRRPPVLRCRDHRQRVRRRQHADHGAHRHRRARRDGHARPVRQVPALASAPRSSPARPTCRGRAATTKYITHFPESREIWSFGSGYGGNALLGKKCYSLRIASAMARDEGWIAEHMLILKLTEPGEEVTYVAAAFPSACGKTNMAMIEPTVPGWTAEMIGDDICWMHFGEDGRLYAQNPEAGLFGVAPGTGWHTNPNAMRAVETGRSIFTNVALTDDGDVWWEGMTDRRARAPHRLEAARTGRRTPASSPRTRTAGSAPRSATATSSPPSTTTRRACRSRRSSSAAGARASSRWSRRPATGRTASSSARRRAARPRPRRPARSASSGVTRWPCCPSSATTPATTSGTGSRWARPPTRTSCRRSSSSTGSARATTAASCGPDSATTAASSTWIIGRLEGTKDAVETPIGLVPTPASLDTEGLDLPAEDLEQVLAVDAEEWKHEVELIEEWFATIGEKTPTSLVDELDALKVRLGIA